MVTPAGGRAPMLRPFDELRRYTIAAVDGEVGELMDVYFDDASWTVRHLVIDTGRWLPGRRVLVPPRAVRGVDGGAERVAIDLTMQRLRDAPAADTERPVSRQHEIELYGYYGYPFYWTGPYRWGLTPDPMGADAPAPPPAAVAPPAPREPGDPHLRSAREVQGYTIAATDGNLGHVEDLLVDEASWAIRYFVVDPRSWWPGPHVLVPTDWITGVSWADRSVQVDVTREAVRNAPEYVEPAVARDYEERLYGHYRRPAYWEREPEYWSIWPPAA